jgi:hypothetical protein
VDHEPVPLTEVSVCLGHECGDALQSLILKFSHPSADRAEEMFVLRDIARRFESLEAFIEVAFDDETTFYQQLNGTIDGRQSRLAAALLKLTGQFLDRQMTVRA